MRETKIGILSDTHLYGVTPELVALYRRFLEDVDMILHAGDFVSWEVVDFLSKKPFHGVQGNMDTKRIKEGLPEKEIIEIGPFRIGLIHGWGSPRGLEERIQERFEGVDAIVYGHSHRPVNRTRDGVLFFNPGTALGYASSGGHSIGILILGKRISGEIIEID